MMDQKRAGGKGADAARKAKLRAKYAKRPGSACNPSLVHKSNRRRGQLFHFTTNYSGATGAMHNMASVQVGFGMEMRWLCFTWQ